MNPSSSSDAPSTVQGERVARRLAAGLIAAFVLVVFYSFLDKAGRNRLETVKETRVGKPSASVPPTRE